MVFRVPVRVIRVSLVAMLAGCGPTATLTPMPTGTGDPQSTHAGTPFPRDTPGVTTPSTSRPTPSEPSTTQPTAVDLIVGAAAAGEIDAATALLYRAFAVLGDPRLPPEFHGVGAGPGEDLLPFLTSDEELAALPEDIRSQLLPYLLPPTDLGSAFNDPDTSAVLPAVAPVAHQIPGLVAVTCLDDGWGFWHALHPVKVWARCTGDYEATIEGVVRIVNELWQPMTAYMGEPVLDLGGPAYGGDESIDIYLIDDTVCAPGTPRCFTISTGVGGWAQRIPPFGEPPGQPSSGRIALRRSQVSADPDTSRRYLIHELFHVLQYAHNSAIISGPTGMADANGSAINDVWWFVEASAEWAAYHFERRAGRDASAAMVHSRFVNGFQTIDASLHSRTPSAHRYAAYIWPFFAAQESGDSVVADAWDFLTAATSWHEAMEVIQVHTPFGLYFRDFAVRNINIDVTIDNSDPIPKRYQEADPNFPEGPPQGPQWSNWTIVEVTDNPIAYGETVQPLSAHYWPIEITGGDDVQRITFDFSGFGDEDILDVDGLVGLRVNGSESQVKWEHRRLPEPEALFCRSIPEEDLYLLYLVLANHDTDIPLEGSFSIHGSGEPCRGYEVTIVTETTGGPWDPTRLTITAIVEPDEPGSEEDDGVLEGFGRAFGSYLHSSFETGCESDDYRGVSYVALTEGTDDFQVTGGPLDPPLLHYLTTAPEIPKETGQFQSERPAQYAPGDDTEGIVSCDAYSRVVITVTVRPLEPAP